jgi:hypothetical protein
MSFLQKAKEKAGEVARDAAEATTRAAGAAAAKAQDPETQERVKGGLATAGRTAAHASVKAADASAKAATAVAAKAQDPGTQAKVKGGIQKAGRGARTMVERIDPGILAEVVIKATALQEKANSRLRQKGSIYRIGELLVTASIPPGISFTILRVDDAPGEPAADRRSSTEILAAEEAAAIEAARRGADAAPDIVSLDGEEQAAIALEMAETEASLDAAVDAIVAAEAPEPSVEDGAADKPS